MKYLEMKPSQLRDAIQSGTPAVLPLGVVEYHGEHLPLGVDAFVAMEAVARVEAKHPDLIVLPAFYYGAASYAVASPENHGTIHVDAMHLLPVAEDIFQSLLRIGLRNVHLFIAHQTEEFSQGMPTDLAFRLAARHAIFSWLEQNVHEGWWGDESQSNYYSGANNPFDWIQVHPVRSGTDLRKKIPSDHAGKTETSEMLAIDPSLVDMDGIDQRLWYCRPAADATSQFGEEALSLTAMEMEEILYGEGTRHET